jgi:hypothetical protein
MAVLKLFFLMEKEESHKLLTGIVEEYGYVRRGKGGGGGRRKEEGKQGDESCGGSFVDGSIETVLFEGEP